MNLTFLFLARFSGLCSTPRFSSFSVKSTNPWPCCIRKIESRSAAPSSEWISVARAIRVSEIALTGPVGGGRLLGSTGGGGRGFRRAPEAVRDEDAEE